MLDQVLRSSRNPEKLSLTIKGTLLQIVPIVIGVSYLFGIEGVDETFLKGFIDVLAALVVGVTSLVALSMQGYGLLRKLWN